MLQLPNLVLSSTARGALAQLQVLVNAGADFPARAALATDTWKRKTSRKAHQDAFTEIRDTLSKMAFGSVRCAYCEDSAADEIEHIAPKTVVPSRAFDWMNYCFACGPCNAPKGNQHATVNRLGTIVETDAGALTDEPKSSALFDPRIENGFSFLEIDIGGLAPSGTQLVPTSDFRIRTGLTKHDAARARYTIDTLRLNREIVRKARETALVAYRASLFEYAADKTAGASEAELTRRKDAILAMPHPSVLNELLRQRATQPKVQAAIAAAPEIAAWLR